MWPASTPGLLRAVQRWKHTHIHTHTHSVSRKKKRKRAREYLVAAAVEASKHVLVGLSRESDLPPPPNPLAFDTQTLGFPCILPQSYFPSSCANYVCVWSVWSRTHTCVFVHLKKRKKMCCITKMLNRKMAKAKKKTPKKTPNICQMLNVLYFV